MMRNREQLYYILIWPAFNQEYGAQFQLWIWMRIHNDNYFIPQNLATASVVQEHGGQLNYDAQ
jgi:hypothetical protein